jgi:YidC/Oxa1 family membrane protein insertase
VKLIADVNSRKTLAEINYKPLQIRPDMQFSQVFYAGPKSVEKLRGIDPELPSLVDFGWLGFIASPLVKLLRVLFDLVGNWGWAIYSASAA